jgi:hypothetical protein
VDTPAGASPPDLEAGVDIEGFAPPPDFAVTRLLKTPPPTPGRFHILPDGRQTALPACPFPVRGSKDLGELSPTIDGDLADWHGVPPLAVDREGDGVASGTASYDLVRVYAASDAEAYSFAFVLKDDYPVGDWSGSLGLNIFTRTPSSDATLLPDMPYVGRITIEDGQVRQIPPPDALVASRGHVVELRVARSKIAPLVAGGPVLFAPFASLGPVGPFDEVGMISFGNIRDYLCLVPMPGKRWITMAFHRASDATAEQAEMTYRAAAAAAPFVEGQLADAVKRVDTIDVLALPKLGPSGVYYTTGQMLLRPLPMNPTTSGDRPLDLFLVAAHEYAHALNTGDYGLPRHWMREGHSEWAARRAAAAAFNVAIAQNYLNEAASMFTTEELERGVASIDAETWPAAGHTLDFSYGKANSFFHVLETLLPYDRLHPLLRQGADAQPFESTTDFLSAVAADPHFRSGGRPADWSGWLGGDYGSSLVDRAELQRDSDGDGLLDDQEAAFGTRPDAIDTDGDGAGDLYEIAAGRDPTRPEPITTVMIDNHLGDWDRFAPGLLRTVTPRRTGAAACTNTPSLRRVAVAFDGDFVAAAVELTAPPGETNFRVVVFLTEPSGRELQFSIRAGQTVGWAYDGNRPLRPLFPFAPFRGTTVEAAYHRTWLGWGRDAPAGVTVRVGTFVGPTGQQCEGLDRAPLAYFPAGTAP